MVNAPDRLQCHWNDIWHTAIRKPYWFEKDAFLAEILRFFRHEGEISTPLLDVGCGRGNLVRCLAGQGYTRLYGTDFSVASMREGNVFGAVADCNALCFRSDSFNSIFAVLLIEHVPGYEQFMREACRLLRPGGRLYLVFPNRYSLVTPVVWLKQCLARSGGALYHSTLAPGIVAANALICGLRHLRTGFLSIGTYRGGLSRLASHLVASLLPDRFREEVLMVLQKPGDPGDGTP